MAAIYLFSESLTTQQICAMHRLGPGYKVSPFLKIFLNYNFKESAKKYEFKIKCVQSYKSIPSINDNSFSLAVLLLRLHTVEKKNKGK